MQIHREWTTLMKSLTYPMTYLNFRLDIGERSLNHVNEFAFATKPLKGGKIKSQSILPKTQRRS